MEVVRPPADPAGGKLHGRHPRGGFDHAIQSLHFNYQQRSCIGLTIVLDGRILLCTAEKLVIRDHSSWKHVGCLMYTYSYRIRNGLTMRAHWEGFARYSWQACIPRSFFQMSCWWSIYTYFNNTFLFAMGLLLCSMWGFGSVPLRSFEPRDFSSWQHVGGHFYFHSLALPDYWSDFWSSLVCGFIKFLASPWCWLHSWCSSWVGGLLVSMDSWAGSASLGSLVYVVLLILVLRGISVHIFSPLAFRVVAVQIGLQKSALAGSRLANCAYWWVARTLWPKRCVRKKKKKSSNYFACSGSHTGFANRKCDRCRNCSDPFASSTAKLAAAIIQPGSLDAQKSEAAKLL